MPFEFADDDAVETAPVLSERQCYEIIRELIGFPYNQVCVNYAALMLMSEMQKSGMEVDREFAGDVVNARDDQSLAYIRQKLEGIENHGTSGRV